MNSLFYIESKQANTLHVTDSVDVSSAIDAVYAEQWQSILMSLNANHLQRSLNENKM